MTWHETKLWTKTYNNRGSKHYLTKTHGKHEGLKTVHKTNDNYPMTRHITNGITLQTWDMT